MLNFIFVLLFFHLQIAAMLRGMIVFLLSVYLVNADEDIADQCVTRGKLSIQVYD